MWPVAEDDDLGEWPGDSVEFLSIPRLGCVGRGQSVLFVFKTSLVQIKNFNPLPPGS